MPKIVDHDQRRRDLVQATLRLHEVQSTLVVVDDLGHGSSIGMQIGS